MSPYELKPHPKPKVGKRVKRALQRKTRIRQCRNTPRRIQGKRNPALVGWIHTLPCHRCWVRDRQQTTRTEASHMPFSRRFGDELNVQPLCTDCHTGAFDSWHGDKRGWYATHGGRRGVAETSRYYTERFYRETA